VLDRLLAKESYFIEHAAQSKSGIARVVLYNAGSSPTAGNAQTATRVVPVVPQLAPGPAQGPVVVPTPAPAVVRYPQPAPVTRAVVPPIRRVQPPQPPAVQVRPTAAVPAPLQTPGKNPSQTAKPSTTSGPPAPEARKRGGIIQ
jgi:hypothetical protein